jgi:hypothetical protein
MRHSQKRLSGLALVLMAGAGVYGMFLPWVYLEAGTGLYTKRVLSSPLGHASLVDLMRGRMIDRGRDQGKEFENSETGLTERADRPRSVDLDTNYWFYAFLPALWIVIAVIGLKWLLKGTAAKGLQYVSLACCLAAIGLCASVAWVSADPSLEKEIVWPYSRARGISLPIAMMPLSLSYVWYVEIGLCVIACGTVGVPLVTPRIPEKLRRQARRGLFNPAVLMGLVATSGLVVAALGWLAVPLYKPPGWFHIVRTMSLSGMILAGYCILIGLVDLFLPRLRCRVLWCIATLSYPVGQLFWKPGSLL